VSTTGHRTGWTVPAVSNRCPRPNALQGLLPHSRGCCSRLVTRPIGCDQLVCRQQNDQKVQQTFGHPTMRMESRDSTDLRYTAAMQGEGREGWMEGRGKGGREGGRGLGERQVRRRVDAVLPRALCKSAARATRRCAGGGCVPCRLRCVESRQKRKTSYAQGLGRERTCAGLGSAEKNKKIERRGRRWGEDCHTLVRNRVGARERARGCRRACCAAKRRTRTWLVAALPLGDAGDSHATPHGPGSGGGNPAPDLSLSTRRPARLPSRQARDLRGQREG
jgi:hypothetical protein